MDETQSGGEGSVGPVIGLIIIMLIIILGGLYFWGERSKQNDAAEAANTAQAIDTQSSSDDAASIEADLDATDIDSLDQDLY